MFWNLVTKILVNVLVDVLVTCLVKLVVSAGNALLANYRKAQQQVSFA